MKHSITSPIALIASLLAIIAVSGCTSGTDGPAAAPPASVTPAPVSPGGVTPSSLFDHSKFAWYRYSISSSDMKGMAMVHTYAYSDETISGQPARHVNITEDMRPETLVYLDIWSTPSDGSTLKIHESVYKMDKLKIDADIDAANYTQLEAEDLASPKFTAARLAAAGSDVVTIGNKTYATIKYTGSAGDQQYAYWASQDVPVPVKFTVHDANTGVDTVYELSGWGTAASMAPTLSAQPDMPAMDMPAAPMAPMASA